MQSAAKQTLPSPTLALFILTLSIQTTVSAQVSLDNRLLTQNGQEETGDMLGEAMAPGDFNGDGFDDLAVGTPHEDFTGSDEGAVWIYFGSADGLSTNWGQAGFQFNIADVTCGGSESGDLFGWALASGDFNNDGYDDLAVGSPEEDIESPAVSEAGMVQIIMGTPTGLDIAGASCLYQLTGFLLPGTAGTGDWLGRSLAVGNFDADPYDDLAIGAPFDGTGGTVTVVHGAAGGLDIANATVWSQNTTGILDSEEAGDSFGSALATGNLFDTSVFACDLVVGVAGEDISSGAFQVIYGCDPGLTATGNQIWRLSDLATPQTPVLIDSLGASLAVGNFDCNDGMDVAAGAPFRNTPAGANAGAVAVFYSGGVGGLVSTNSEFIEAIGNNPSANERFGEALAAANVDGQCDDLFVGAPFAEREGTTPPNHGQLVLLSGTAGQGLLPLTPDDWDFARIGLGSEMHDDDHLGSSITVGRFNGITPSVAVGVPDYDIIPETDTGTVLVLETGFLLFADGFESGSLSRWSSSSP